MAHVMPKFRASTATILLLSLSALATACLGTNSAQPRAGQKQPVAEESIGTAMMKDDGTIVLRLRARTSAGALGEGVLTYPRVIPNIRKLFPISARFV